MGLLGSQAGEITRQAVALIEIVEERKLNENQDTQEIPQDLDQD